MSNNSSVELTGKIVELLSPLESEERLRIIDASLILLGEKPAGAGKSKYLPDRDDVAILPQRARLWIEQNKIKVEQIQQIFQLGDAAFEVIASPIPGKSTKDQTLNTYILTGIGNLLITGEPSFPDNQARSLCKNSGCYDSANHSAYLKNRGNVFTGNKKTGWSLTGPGLKLGAELIKELN